MSWDHCEDIGEKLGITRYEVFTSLTLLNPSLPWLSPRLWEEGLFTEDLIDLVSIQFASDLFERNDLLHLLCDLCVIVKVQHSNVYYFIPTGLSLKHLTYEEKKKIAITCGPLVLTFEHGVVPQICKPIFS